MGLVERFASLPLKYVLIIVAIVKFGLVVCLCSLDYCTSADPEPVPQLFEFILKEHSYFRHLTLNMHCKAIGFYLVFLSYHSNMFLLRCSCLNNCHESTVVLQSQQQDWAGWPIFVVQQQCARYYWKCKKGESTLFASLSLADRQQVLFESTRNN